VGQPAEAVLFAAPGISIPIEMFPLLS